MLEVQDTDLLILGSGLAGLRAALSAHLTNPALRITIVSTGPGPNGSSFANRNNCLGMQVCFDSDDQDDLVHTATTLAHPGQIDASLARIMAAESLERFEDLVRLGFTFRRNASGQWLRHPACFSPNSRRALIFDDLRHAYTCFRAALDSPQIIWIHGRILRLIQDGYGSPVSGAAGVGNSLFAVRSPATVIALGGPATLFRHQMGGPGATGWSYGLLHAAGVPVVNSSFLQILWATIPSGSFFPIHTLTNPEWSIGPDRIALPESLAHLASARAGHCPYGHGLPDNQLDQFLANYLLSDGSVEVSAGGLTHRIAPMVHAGNGGAIIDKHGRTCLAGLYACGECATGMHGANRIGGGMVLATQVFGHRIGIHAAQSIEHKTDVDKKSFAFLANKVCSTQLPTTNAPEKSIPGVDWIMTKNTYPDTENVNFAGCWHNTNSNEEHAIDLAALGRNLIVRHHQSLSKRSN